VGGLSNAVDEDMNVVYINEANAIYFHINI